MAEQTMTNQAFIFIKPHAADSDKVLTLVEEQLEKRGITIHQIGESTKCRIISSGEIDKKGLIDQHYYAIASKATLKTPDQLNVPADRFKEQFGVEWADVLSQGLAFNAIDGAKKVGMDAYQLEAEWRVAKKEKRMIKFGGGFYCAKIQDYYLFNGFFMSMREKYVAEGKRIVAYSVSWNEDKLSWEDFRGKVLGPTDPTTAPTDSIRGMIYAQWKELGLEAQPDTGDNGVHASASPFEGLAEHMNWLGAFPDESEFGRAMLKGGVKLRTLSEWSTDPQVFIDQERKKTGSIFDQLEDQNASKCLANALKLAGLNQK